MPPPEARDRLIVALDVDSLARAEELVAALGGVVSTFKVGGPLFTAAGPAAVELVRKRGGKVFLDLKHHDIPAAVAGAVREAARLGVAMLTVHASGGSAMLRAAVEAAREARTEGRPLVLAVTLLTSLDRRALHGELRIPASEEALVLHLAQLAREAGCDGCVASPRELRSLRRLLGRGWVVVTPGIRPAAVAGDDQARTASPEAAIAAGADYLVVGRPITGAPDPAKAAAGILEAIR